MRVLAALSGGVDSAVAAARAVADGHDVTGVHMALSANPQSCRVGSRGCCSLEDGDDARASADRLGIPFYIWDLAESFEQRVINDFVAEYQAGRTPNPCVRCNEFVKFHELLERAEIMGFEAVCTGHYARVIAGSGGPQLHRALDTAKDQSYVLAVMGRQRLGKVLFPLGEVTSKAQTRQEAQNLGLSVSDKPDSFDICFIPDGDTGGFLSKHLGENPGDIVDTNGQILGTHSGYYRFTVGQRRGLRIERPAEDGKPRYVLTTNPQTNQVVVGPSQLLSVNQIIGTSPIWLVPDNHPVRSNGPALAGVSVQFRAHGCAIPAKVRVGSSGQVVADLAKSVRGIAAGQSLVIYLGDQVLGQATISGAKTR